MQNPMEAPFAPLEKAVDEALLANPKAVQAIAVRTAEGSIYCTPIFSVEDSAQPEAMDFAQSLVDMDDTLLRYILCKWQAGSLTVTAGVLTKRLIAIHPQNADAQILLQGFGQRNVRTLKDTL